MLPPYGIIGLLIEASYVIWSVVVSSMVARTDTGRILQYLATLAGIVAGLTILLFPEILTTNESTVSVRSIFIGLFLSILALIRLIRSRNTLLYDISAMAVSDLLHAILFLLLIMLVLYFAFPEPLIFVLS